ALGLLGEDHLRARLDAWYGVKRWWYRKASVTVGGVPYVLEVALAATERRGGLFHGVNFSPTFEDPLANTALEVPQISAHGVEIFLARAHANPRGRDTTTHTAAAFHLVCPALEFLDKGKTRLRVPGEVATAIARVLWLVTKELYAEEERRQRDAA